MYTLVSSLCLGRTIGAQWQTPDLTNVFMNSVLSEFKTVYLVVTHPASEDPLYVDLDAIRVQLSSYAGSVGQWLIDQDGVALPTVPSLPDGRIRYAKYGSASQANYILNFVKAGFNQPPGVSTLNMPDLRMTRPSVSTPMRTMDTHCLVTVNGLVHPTVSNDTETYILEGGKTARRCKETHVGIWSFLGIGALTKIPLTDDNLSSYEPDGTMWQKLRIGVDVDMQGKTPILIMGGFPTFLSADGFHQNGANSFGVDLRKTLYEERVIYARDQIDLSSLQLEVIDDAPNHIDQEQLRSDEVIRRFFQLPQSFLVLVDTPQLFIKHIPVLRAAFPGQHLHTENPVYPLVGPFGKFLEYWKRREAERWTLQCRDHFVRRYMFKDGPGKQAVHIDEALDPTFPFDHVYGRLLEVAGLPNP